MKTRITLLFFTLFLSIKKPFAQVGIQTVHKAFFQSSQNSKLLFSKKTNPIAPKIAAIPLAYNYHQLAFFCKMEVKIDKVNVAPVRFRLGSLDYANWLEGK